MEWSTPPFQVFLIIYQVSSDPFPATIKSSQVPEKLLTNFGGFPAKMLIC